MTDYNERIKEVINKKKKEKGYRSVEEVAEDMKRFCKENDIEEAVSKSALHSYTEPGGRKPSYESLNVLCRYFEVSADWIMGLPLLKTYDEKVRRAARFFGVAPDTIAELKKVFDIAEGGHLLSVFEGVIQDEKFGLVFQELKNVNEFVLLPGDPAFITMTNDMYKRRGIPEKQRELNRKVMIVDGFESAVYRSHQNAAAVIDNAIKIIKNGGLKK